MGYTAVAELSHELEQRLGDGRQMLPALGQEEVGVPGSIHEA
jgi:hypothetical protein